MAQDTSESDRGHLRAETSRLKTNPKFLYAYAYLYECALSAVRSMDEAEAGRTSEVLAHYGKLLGLQNGPDEPQEVRFRWGRARCEAQKIAATSLSLTSQVRAFEDLCRSAEPLLPPVQPQKSPSFFEGIHMQRMFRQIDNFLWAIHHRSDALISRDWPALELAAAERGERFEPDHLSRNLKAARTASTPSHSMLTLFWWHTGIPKYRGKWIDMHALAIEWKLSTAELENFRRYVRRLGSGTSFPPAPPVGIPNVGPV